MGNELLAVSTQLSAFSLVNWTIDTVYDKRDRGYFLTADS